MFFCTNLVFAASDIESTRIIQKDIGPDITVSLVNTEFVLTNAVLDPVTHDNIETYIVKDNVPVVFSFQNVDMEPRAATLQNYYYRTYSGKNLKIRCMDTVYSGGNVVRILPESVYNFLKVTNRLEDCLFIFEFDYTINSSGETSKRKMKYAFKIVSDKGYEMYQNIEKAIDIDVNDKNGTDIKRPKRIKE